MTAEKQVAQEDSPLHGILDDREAGLEIRWNNMSISHERCALCGEPDRAMEGPELFVIGDSQRVCHACGEKRSTWIVARLKKLQQAYLDGRITP